MGVISIPRSHLTPPLQSVLLHRYRSVHAPSRAISHPQESIWFEVVNQNVLCRIIYASKMLWGASVDKEIFDEASIWNYLNLVIEDLQDDRRRRIGLLRRADDLRWCRRTPRKELARSDRSCKNWPPRPVRSVAIHREAQSFQASRPAG
jgi:hypothetical protein